jgi:hypothetical protein
MIKTVLTVAFCVFACAAFAAEGVPTPADNTVSVLASAPTTQTVVVAAAPACCETAKEVRLTAWQSRRLSRQADRQEARDARDCCNCDCPSKKDCRTKALVLTKSRPACNCCN